MSDLRPESQIVVVLLPDNRVCVRSTCAGVPDAAYTPLHDCAAPAEIAKLLGELRQREAGATPPSMRNQLPNLQRPER